MQGRNGFGTRLLAALAGLAAVALTGCSTTSTFGPPPTFAASPDYRYLIGTGDSVNVIVWRNPELSMTVPVRPDGRLTMPLVEDLPALGRSPTELARDIEKALAKFVRDPVVTVIVTGASGPFSEQIRIIGEATRPQALPYRQDMTMLDVMIAVGGPPERPDQARRHFGQRRRQARRRADHSAELVLTPAGSAGAAGCGPPSQAPRTRPPGGPR